jgi:hypothetical protein
MAMVSDKHHDSHDEDNRTDITALAALEMFSTSIRGTEVGTGKRSVGGGGLGGAVELLAMGEDEDRLKDIFDRKTRDARAPRGVGVLWGVSSGLTPLLPQNPKS